MPGGPKKAYDIVSDIFQKVAAQTPAGPCVAYLGKGGSGNFVKMVHNGIEYGDMQLIAEAYNLMRNVFGMDCKEISDTFTKWNKGKLLSYLIEITAQILTKTDDLTNDGTLVLDKIKDKTGSKGTGKWTVQQAADCGVAAPTISAALEARYLSAKKEERIEAAKVLKGPAVKLEVDAAGKAKFLEDLENALYLAKIASYAQGMSIIQAKSDELGWGINLSECGRIWMGGCIIRSSFLTNIMKAYKADPKLCNLLMDPDNVKIVNGNMAALRRICGLAITHGIPGGAFCGSLAYIDSYRTARLPACLTQAQRDFFGAHTYERLDKPAGEWFHTAWSEAHNIASISGSYNN